MHDQSLGFSKSLDSWEAIVVIAVIALISSVFRDGQHPMRRRADLKVFFLSEYCGTHQDNQRARGHFKLKS